MYALAFQFSNGFCPGFSLIFIVGLSQIQPNLWRRTLIRHTLLEKKSPHPTPQAQVNLSKLFKLCFITFRWCVMLFLVIFLEKYLQVYPTFHYSNRHGCKQGVSRFTSSAQLFAIWVCICISICTRLSTRLTSVPMSHHSCKYCLRMPNKETIDAKIPYQKQ